MNVEICLFPTEFSLLEYNQLPDCLMDRYLPTYLFFILRRLGSAVSCGESLTMIPQLATYLNTTIGLDCMV